MRGSLSGWPLCGWFEPLFGFGASDIMLPGRGPGFALPPLGAPPMNEFFTMHPGETAPPLPPGPVLCTGTAGMRRIHRFFLWAYDEAGLGALR